MGEFNVRSESVDVERLMGEIRARIREKRGVDYTEQQIRELAAARLDKFLDPANVRSGLLEHYRERAANDPAAALLEPPHLPPPVDFDPETIYRSSRGVFGRVLYGIRRLLRPLLKLFFNPGPITHALHAQQEFNRHLAWQAKLSEQVAARLRARAELDALTYELLNNLVVEMTRLSIDVKNHKMRVESVSGRLDFDERRQRALETVVAQRTRIAPAPASASADADAGGAGDEAAGEERRKRRRRRGGRRRGGARAAVDGAPAAGDAADSAGDGEAVTVGEAHAAGGAPAAAGPSGNDAPGPAADAAPADPAPAARSEADAAPAVRGADDPPAQ